MSSHLPEFPNSTLIFKKEIEASVASSPKKVTAQFWGEELNRDAVPPGGKL